MNLRTPLARVRGLGSARHGTHHWIHQRLTALALIPIVLWLSASLAYYATQDYQSAHNWVHRPMVSVILLLTIGALFHHAQLGLQVVVEDYVHTPWIKFTTLILMKFACIALAVAGVYAVIRIALQG